MPDKKSTEEIFAEHAKRGEQLIAPFRESATTNISYHPSSKLDAATKAERQERVRTVLNEIREKGGMKKGLDSVVIVPSDKFHEVQTMMGFPIPSKWAATMSEAKRTYLNDAAFSGVDAEKEGIKPEDALLWALSHEVQHLNTDAPIQWQQKNDSWIDSNARETVQRVLKGRAQIVANQKPPDWQVANAPNDSKKFDISHLYDENSGLVPPERAGNNPTVALGTLAPDVNPLVTEGSRAMGRKVDTETTVPTVPTQTPGSNPDAAAIFASFAEQGRQLLQPFKGK